MALSEDQQREIYLSLSASEKAQFESLSPLERLNSLRDRAGQQVSIPQGTRYELEQFFNELPDSYKWTLGGLSQNRRVERLFELKEYHTRTGNLPKLPG